MADSRVVGSLVYILLIILLAVIPVLAAARILTAKELALLLAKKVVIPNRFESNVVKTPKATPWPEEFTIEFTTDNGTASGILIYDWENKQQVILHGHGSTHCLERGTSGLCYILENPKGTYEIDPANKKCELTNPGVGSVPPTWVVQGVFAGVEEVNGVKCNRFNYPPSPHAWLETVNGGLPCAFVFPYPPLTYYFVQSTLKLKKPSPFYFMFPDYCPSSYYADAEEDTLKDH